MCFTLPVTLQSFSCSSLGCKPLHLFIPFICGSGDESQRLSFHRRSNDTETQNWQTHRSEHRFSFLHHLPLHSPPPHVPLPPPTPPASSLEICCNSRSDCHISFCRSRKENKLSKVWKIMISLSSSQGLSCAICFDIPPHQLLYLTILCREDIKSRQTGENTVAGAYSNIEY